MEACEWVIVDNETREWRSGCGKKHNMNSNWHCTPIEAGFKVCPYCGNRLTQDTTGYIPHYDHYNREHRILAKRYGT